MATATALLLFVERGVDKIDVFLVHFILGQSQTFAKPLEVDDLSGPEKFDDIVYIRIIGEAQDIIIGDSSLLLCRQIFCKVGKPDAAVG